MKDAKKAVHGEPGAESYAATELATLYIASGDLKLAEDYLEESKVLLESLAGLDYQIHASQYKSLALFSKVNLLLYCRS